MNNYRKPISWMAFYQTAHSVCDWKNWRKTRRLKFWRTLSPKRNFRGVYSLRRDALNWKKQNFNQNLRTCYFVKSKKKNKTKHQTLWQGKAVKRSENKYSFNQTCLILQSWKKLQCCYNLGPTTILLKQMFCNCQKKKLPQCSGFMSFPSLFLPNNWILVKQENKNPTGPITGSAPDFERTSFCKHHIKRMFSQFLKGSFFC